MQSEDRVVHPKSPSSRAKLLFYSALAMAAVGGVVFALVSLPPFRPDFDPQAPTPQTKSNPPPAAAERPSRSVVAAAAAPDASLARTAAASPMIADAAMAAVPVSRTGDSAGVPASGTHGGVPGEATLRGTAQAPAERTAEPMTAGVLPGVAAPNASANLSSAAGDTAAVGASTGVPEIVIEVPAGERVPAVFYETDPKPAPQQRMLDRIAAEFNQTVANPPAGVSEAAIWEHARRRADEQYLKLYGHAAYNARHLEAAREAVRETRALKAVPQQGDAAVSAQPGP